MNRSTSSLSYYLQLQGRRWSRTLDENGIYPWMVIPLSLLIFAFISFRLLNGMNFGEYIYGALALSICSSIFDSRRYDFVKSISRNDEYQIIRLAENLLIVFPFIIGYLVFGWFLPALLLFFGGIVFLFISRNPSMSFAMPTPFGRRPFEFSRGIRRAVLLIMGSYVLVPIGISVDNFNLSLSSIAAIGFISGNYFTQPEPKFYLWIHADTSNRFLINKSKTIFLYGLMSMLPIIIALAIYDYNKIAVISLMVITAIAFIEMCMLAKYIAYPAEVNIVAGLAMGASILFPPLMLLIIPVFYIKAQRQLDQYLR